MLSKKVKVILVYLLLINGLLLASCTYKSLKDNSNKQKETLTSIDKILDEIYHIRNDENLNIIKQFLSINLPLDKLYLEMKREEVANANEFSGESIGDLQKHLKRIGFVLTSSDDKNFTMYRSKSFIYTYKEINFSFDMFEMFSNGEIVIMITFYPSNTKLNALKNMSTISFNLYKPFFSPEYSEIITFNAGLKDTTYNINNIFFISKDIYTDINGNRDYYIYDGRHSVNYEISLLENKDIVDLFTNYYDFTNDIEKAFFKSVGLSKEEYVALCEENDLTGYTQININQEEFDISKLDILINPMH